MAKKDSRTDAELIEAARTGDTAAFETLYYRYRDWVVRVAMRFTNNRDDALESLQDTFAYLLRKLPNLYLSARMTTFLYPVVKHCALTATQKTRRLTLTDETTPEPAAEPATQDLTAADTTRRSDLETALAGLPAEQRETLFMRFVDDLPLADIAAALDCPLGTVKSRIHNALQALRNDPRARRFFEA